MSFLPKAWHDYRILSSSFPFGRSRKMQYVFFLFFFLIFRYAYLKTDGTLVACYAPEFKSNLKFITFATRLKRVRRQLLEIWRENTRRKTRMPYPLGTKSWTQQITARLKSVKKKKNKFDSIKNTI